jgi:hypothetical protein
MTGWEQLIYKAPTPRYPCGCLRTASNTLTQRYKGNVIRRCRACHLQRIYDRFHDGVKPGKKPRLPFYVLRNASQWDSCYRGIIQHYRRKAYLARNPFFVEPYVNDEGVMQ